jgi:hypothetical protein
MSSKLKFSVEAILFTLSKFILQLSSFLFLFLIIFATNEQVFNKTQFLINLTNILSYPAIAISTIIIIFPNFFKMYFKKIKNKIDILILIITIFSLSLTIYHVFIDINFQHTILFNILWVFLTTINLYLLYFLVAIYIINKNFYIPIVALLFASLVKFLGSISGFYDIASDEFLLNIPLISIFILPLLLTFNYKKLFYKTKNSSHSFIDKNNKSLHSIYIKSLSVFLFAAFQYLDFFIISNKVSNIYDFNYGFIFLLGKIGFHITSTLFYSLFIFFDFPGFKKYTKHKLLFAFLICLFSYLMLFLVTSVLHKFVSLDFIEIMNISHNKFWIAILTTNFLQSLIYFLIFLKPIKLKTLYFTLICLFIYSIILNYGPIAFIKELLVSTNLLITILLFYHIFPLKKQVTM